MGGKFVHISRGGWVRVREVYELSNIKYPHPSTWILEYMVSARRLVIYFHYIFINKNKNNKLINYQCNQWFSTMKFTYQDNDVDEFNFGLDFKFLDFIFIISIVWLCKYSLQPRKTQRKILKKKTLQRNIWIGWSKIKTNTRKKTE